MSNGKEDDSVGSWSKHNRHINELQHLRQAVQVPTKYPSATLTRADTDIRKRTKTADTSHKKSKSFFDGSPYMTASPQPLESETAESSFIPKRDPTVKRRARSASSVGPSPTPSTSSSRVSSIDNPSFSLSMDKNKSWLQMSLLVQIGVRVRGQPKIQDERMETKKTVNLLVVIKVRITITEAGRWYTQSLILLL
jgi:hypothetical protein